MDANDTIAAISTPIGTGGIGIVRLSGPRAVEIAESLFVGSCRPMQAPSRELLYGKVVEDGEEIDEVLLSIMRTPHSYTTEDVVEINGHGGMVAVQRVLDAVCRRGARLAEPGEFTRRAFLGGRIDLAQAEAVTDVIRAQTERSLRSAYRSMQGELSGKINTLKQRLQEDVARIELTLDFSDEEVPLVNPEELKARIAAIREEIERLSATFQRGKIEREGIRAAIVGKPNVGKSCIMNALLAEERVIVTPIPGTTRDSVEERVDIEGLAVSLIDTAGIRETMDIIESAGKQRTVTEIEGADLILLVLDGSAEIDEEDRSVGRATEGTKRIVVINKCDLPRVADRAAAEAIFPGAGTVEISAKERWGLVELEALIAAAAQGGTGGGSEGIAVQRLRHKICLDRASGALQMAHQSIIEGVSYEYVALDFREALDALGEIVGETTSEDILNHIFSEFCIGK
ncbi:MAG: tRNA uridine-5-carboxymethylaminomethyl(34) synthesis GTPase MnmE [Candidatus Latescibacteria bacterium]|nr:tRNA uridine-5-carboxymethylaminomethyl(34) synthesis GTPase MnmE [Candidatus Latescibacterota bacterium]